jgi:hypothetical protein
VLDLPGHFPLTLAANYPEFPDSCRRVQLGLLIDVLQVLVDRADILLKQLRDQDLRKPDGLVLEAAIDARPAVFGLIEDDLAAGR